MLNILLIVVAYLFGSLPSAVWIGKRFYGIDVREHGSKNAGATNTFRVLGKKAGSVVFAMDFAKGFAAVMLIHLTGYETNSSAEFAMSIALVSAAVIGHILPIFAGFKGGKGVATVSGAILAMAPGAILLTLITFLIVLAITNYVSVSSMVAATCFPIIAWLVFSYPWQMVVFGIFIAVLIVFTHRKNIRRLIAGTEAKTYLIKNRKDNLREI